MIKVLIVDDSTFLRKTLRQMLEYDPEIEVIDETGDGREAIEKTLSLKPDVITMDIIMPGVDGIWALEEIMKQRPTPVIIVSSIGVTSSDIVQEAFSLGVVDVVQKPSSSQNLTAIRKEVIEKVKAASKIGRLKLLEYQSISVEKKKFPRQFKTHQIVIVVTSAGGPPSLYEVISKFSDNFYAGVVVAQHIPSNFVPSFVSHIQRMTNMNVKLASKGDILYSRRILFSPTDCTLELHQTKKGAVVDLVDYKTRLQPDIDSVIISCANVYKSGTILVVLSGLGNDAVKGAEVVKKLGGKVIVEDKTTAGIFGGMPASVIKSGFYDATCPSYSIADMVEQYLGKKQSELPEDTKKIFLVKGVILRSCLSYIRTNCTTEEYSNILSAISEKARSILNGAINSYNYYPGDLYSEFCESINNNCKDGEVLEKMAEENAEECLRIYKQGFPLSNVEQFINFIPTFQKVVFPGSVWEVLEFNSDSKYAKFLQRGEGYAENNTKLLARSTKGWLAHLFKTINITLKENKSDPGEDEKGCYIQTKVSWE